MASGVDWKALAAATKQRREKLGLTQGALLDRGGPSRETVRQVEIGDRHNYRPVTYTQLDIALEWPHGTANDVRTRELDVDTAVQLDRKYRLPGTEGRPRKRRAVKDQPDDETSDDGPSVVRALTQAAAELSNLPNPTQNQEKALAHVLEALNLVRVPIMWSDVHGRWEVGR